MRHEKNRPLKEDLDILLEKSRMKSALSIGEILKILSGKGRSMILIFLSLPFCQPLQIPGLSTPFGILIILVGFRMAFGKNIWLPKKILLKKVSSETIQKITQKCLHFMNKMKRFIHPRLNWLCDNGPMKIINGLLIAFLGILLALPLPIFLSNMIVAWSLFLISLGLLKNDGVFVLIGYVASLLTIIAFASIAFSFKFVFFN